MNQEQGQVLVCVPSAGGPGVELSLSGLDFRATPGSVTLGGEHCAVVSWSAGQVVVRTPPGLTSTGAYAVNVARGDGSELQHPCAFSIIHPQFEQARPTTDNELGEARSGISRCVAGAYRKRRTFVIRGSGFGAVRGRVLVCGPGGAERPCGLLKWSDRSVRCVIPRSMEQYAKLSVRLINAVGEIQADDHVYFSPPGGGLGKDYRWESEERADANAHTVNFLAHEFMFYPAHGVMGFEIGRGGWTELWYWITRADGTTVSQQMDNSISEVWPVLVGRFLYLIYTCDKHIHFLQLDKEAMPTDDYKNRSATSVKWWCLAETLETDAETTVPVYDEFNGRLYLFEGQNTASSAERWLMTRRSEPVTNYDHDSRAFRWMEGWKNLNISMKKGAAPAACMAHNPVAKLNQILLSWEDAEYMFRFGFLDRDKNCLGPIWYVGNLITKGSPFLISYLDGGAAMTFYGGDDRNATYILVYIPEKWKKDGTPWQRFKWGEYTTFREPRLGVTICIDANDGSLETKLWVYYFDTTYMEIHERCFGYDVDVIGKVKPKNSRVPLVWWDSAHNEPNTDWYWDLPIFGVIEGGPPVCNARNPETDKTSKISFARSDTVSQTWEIKGKAGVFFTYGGLTEAVGCFGEVRLGATFAFSKEFTKTVGAAQNYFSEKRDADKVWVLFLVPKTQTRELEYRSLWRKAFTSEVKTITQIDVVDVKLTHEHVPRSHFTNGLFPGVRKYGDLATYQAPPRDDPNSDDSSASSFGARWHSDADPPVVILAESTVKSSSLGVYLSFKVGVGIKDQISGGIEGEVSTNVTRKISTSATITATFANNRAASANDVESASYHVYWLRTKDDASQDCYWVPKQRIGRCDKPWFLTHQVTNWVYKGGSRADPEPESVDEPDPPSGARPT